MSVKENLIAARALIDTPDKWIKHSLSNKDRTCFCAMGALRRVITRGDYVWIYGSPEYLALEAAVPGFRSIPNYNDDPATTHADIMALFDRAIQAQEERGNG